MLKPEYIVTVRKDGALRAKLMIVTGKSMFTIYRWLATNDISLTRADVLSVICDHLKVKQSDILEPRKRVAV